jgi:hypothetical protein
MLNPDKWVLILSVMGGSPDAEPSAVPIAEYRSEVECTTGASLTIANLEQHKLMKEARFGFLCVPVWSEPIKAVQ